MAFKKKAMCPKVEKRLREMAAEIRGLLYGENGCPEWETRFREIEDDGMSVGLELARLVMEQSVDEQARQMRPSVMAVDDDEVLSTGTEGRSLETEAGRVSWEQPCGYQKKARKAFFPSGSGLGIGRG